MLLDDLITALSDESESLSGILLKTKVFLHQIGKKELAEWVKHEMNGYPTDATVPDYRVLSSIVKANLESIRFRATSHPIPTMHLQGPLKQFCDEAVVVHPISTIEHWANGDAAFLHRPIPMEANGVLQEPLQSGVYIQSAWCETPVTEVRGILVQVRSRLLDFLLELKDEIGSLQESDDIRKKVDAIDTSGMFAKAVFGANTVIVVGDGSYAKATQIVGSDNLVEAARDLADQLGAVLPAAGLPAEVHQKVEQGVADLKQVTSEQTPNPSKVEAALQFIRAALQGATGNLIANGTIQTITHLVGG